MVNKKGYIEDKKVEVKFNLKYLFRIIKYASPYKIAFFLVLVALVVMALANLVVPLLESFIVKNILPNKDFQGLIKIILIIASLKIIIVATDTFQYYYANKYEHKIIFDIRKDLFDKAEKLYFDYYDSVPTGKILMTITDYVNELTEYFSYYAIRFIFSIIEIFLVLIFMFSLNPIFAVIVSAIMLILAIYTYGIKAILKEKRRIYLNKDVTGAAFCNETINGNTVTSIFERKNENAETFHYLTNESSSQYYSFIKVKEVHNGVVSMLWNSLKICLYAACFFMVKNGKNVLADLFAFMVYIDIFYDPVMVLIEAFQVFSEKSINLERIFALMDYPVAISEKENAYDLPLIKGNVKYNDVTFSYDGSHNILEHINLEVKAGQMIALVGPTGAGKSTIINLLNRFYDVSSGSITIDNYDIKEVTIKSLRNQVGVMMQDSFLFSGTIIDNIRYGKIQATDEECIAAAKKIGADVIINKFRDTYWHVIGENGEGLSSGERQLICFARIILNDPRILILDEATSNVDSLTEKHIMKALDVILKERTSFVIAHRLSTIRKADCILYIDNKSIVEKGTHEELMALKGSYYKLTTHQN